MLQLILVQLSLIVTAGTVQYVLCLDEGQETFNDSTDSAEMPRHTHRHERFDGCLSANESSGQCASKLQRLPLLLL